MKKNIQKNEEENNHTKTKLTICIIIIIIIILLLITSCTSSFWGRIGNLFGSIDYIFNKDSKDKNVVTNTNLIFQTQESEITLDDTGYKISYTVKNIKGDDVHCTTSDATIATCIAEKDYVVIYPKAVGTVKIFAETEKNDILYRAETRLKITEGTNGIILDSTSGNIVLSYGKTKKIPYELKGLKDDVTVTVSDDSIASAEAKDGVLTVTAKKAGKVTVTLEVTVNNKVYTTEYTLNIKDKSTNQSTNTTKTTKKTKKTTTKKTTTTKKVTTESTEKPTAPTNPTNPTNPSEKPTDPNKSNNKNLASLTSSTGTVKKVSDTKYEITVGKNVNAITITALPEDSKATIEYTKNVNLTSNITETQIKVIAEDKSEKIYTVVIKKELDGDVSVDKVVADNQELTLEKDGTYTLKVDYDTTSIGELKAFPSDSASVSTVLNNIDLKEGKNTVKLTVTSADGNAAEYTVNIYRPERKIEFNQKSVSIQVEDGTKGLGYKIYEKTIDSGVWEELSGNYNVTVDKVTFKGSVTVEQDIVNITPTKDDVGATHTITLDYNGHKTSAKVTVGTVPYYLTTCESDACKNYDITYTDDNKSRNVIFNTNILGDDFDVTSIAGGIKLTAKNTNGIDTKGEIIITSSDPSVVGVSVSKKVNADGSESFVLSLNALKDTGSADIKITGSAFDKVIKEVSFKATIVAEYNVLLNAKANGGFINSLQANKELVMKPGEVLDLSLYKAYKPAKPDECLYYKATWNTQADGKGTSYALDDKVEIKGNLTLYAIFDETVDDSQLEIVKEEGLVVFENLDLFKNAKSEEELNVSNLIYPGLSGAQEMNFTNDTGQVLTITGIKLEEDTICLRETECVNLGYMIRQTTREANDKFFLRNRSGYTILNQDANTKYTPINYTSKLKRFYTENTIDLGSDAIRLEDGDSTQLTILWKWFDNDVVDTLIGSQVTEDNNEYYLKVSILYTKENKACMKN